MTIQLCRGTALVLDFAFSMSAIASDLIQIGFEPVVAGLLAFGRHIPPGKPLRGARSPAELKKRSPRR